MTPAEPEFSRVLDTEALGEAGKTLKIEASPDERARLAERFGLEGLDSFNAELSLIPEEGGRLFRLTGTFEADVTQTCVVTLEPLETKVSGALDRLYDPAQSENGDDEENFDAEADDPPESALDGLIDVGEAAAEQLALELNPFPRKSGVSLAEISTGPDAEGAAQEGEKALSEPPKGPFAILEKLKKKLK